MFASRYYSEVMMFNASSTAALEVTRREVIIFCNIMSSSDRKHFPLNFCFFCRAAGGSKGTPTVQCKIFSFPIIAGTNTATHRTENLLVCYLYEARKTGRMTRFLTGSVGGMVLAQSLTCCATFGQVTSLLCL